MLQSIKNKVISHQLLIRSTVTIRTGNKCSSEYIWRNVIKVQYIFMMKVPYFPDYFNIKIVSQIIWLSFPLYSLVVLGGLVHFWNSSLCRNFSYFPHYPMLIWFLISAKNVFYFPSQTFFLSERSSRFSRISLSDRY